VYKLTNKSEDAFREVGQPPHTLIRAGGHQTEALTYAYIARMQPGKDYFVWGFDFH